MRQVQDKSYSLGLLRYEYEFSLLYPFLPISYLCLFLYCWYPSLSPCSYFSYCSFSSFSFIFHYFHAYTHTHSITQLSLTLPPLAHSLIHSHPLSFSLSLTPLFVSHARGKIQELNTEIIRLTRELEKYQQENATYLTYEKRLEYNCVYKLFTSHSPSLL